MVVTLLVHCFLVTCSPGDNLDEFIDCTYACEYNRRCPNSQINYIDPETNMFHDIEFFDTPPLYSKLLFWDCISDCISDCDYQCQHIITRWRIDEEEEIYQFHGKWPFLRVLGTQEFFSTIFSIGNFIPHYKGFVKFSRIIREEGDRRRKNSRSILIWNYLYVTVAGMLAWTASSVFHCRDLIITEKLDYFFAGLTVLTGFHAIFARMTSMFLYPKIAQAFTASVAAIFALHILRLYVDWSYTYNMRFNIFFGVLQYILLIMLSCQNYHALQKQKLMGEFKKTAYSSFKGQIFKLCVIPILLVIVTTMAMSLELFDFFSYEWQIDAHALWHLCTIWPSWVLYDFFLEDYAYWGNRQLY